MLKFQTFALTFALTGLAFSGCDRGHDDASHNDPHQASWDLQNTVDKDGFKAKLGDLDKLSQAAGRGAVPTKQTTSGWQILNNFAGGESSGSAAAEAPEAANCMQLMDLFGFGGQAETRGGGFALTDGASCGDAVKEMKSYYSQSLNTLGEQVSWLKTLVPGTEFCGMKVSELAVEPGSAAVGYTLVPSDLPGGMTFEQRLFGAANDDQVGYMTSLVAGCSADAEGCSGAPAFSLVGSTQAIGQLAAKKLNLKNEFAFTMAFDDAKHGGKQDVTTAMKSESEVSGLGDTDLLKATESTSFELSGDPSAAPGTPPYKVLLSLNVEEIGQGRLRVSGSVATNDSDSKPATFKVEFKQSGGSCSVNTRVLDEDLPQDPGTPGVAFDDAKLKGTWISACNSGSVGTFGYTHYTESAAFGKAGVLTRKLTIFSDSSCFPTKAVTEVALNGSYVLLPELPDSSRYDEISEYGLDMRYTSLDVTLKDQRSVEDFNQQAVCNKTDWALAAKRTFAVGDCFFDVGSSTLLNANVMQRASEFTAVRPYAALKSMDMAQSSFIYGETETTRSRISSGAVTTLKHQ